MITREAGRNHTKAGTSFQIGDMHFCLRQVITKTTRREARVMGEAAPPVPNEEANEAGDSRGPRASFKGFELFGSF